MSDNNAHKRAARALQAANPGMSYTRALRAVLNAQRRPLTARLGHDHAGKAVVVNLEPMSHGGSGPHCLVTGDDRSDVLGLLARLGDNLAAGRPRGDVELVVGCTEPIGLTAAHLRLDGGQLVSQVDAIFEQRWELLKSFGLNDVTDARSQGHDVAKVVLILDEYTPGCWLASEPARRWSNHGRSAGIHLVVGAQGQLPYEHAVNHDATPADMVTHTVISYLTHPVLANVPTTISVYGGGRGTLRTPGQWQPEHRLQRADVLTDFTFRPADPGRGSAPDAKAG
jgi:hypothetical protein